MNDVTQLRERLTELAADRDAIAAERDQLRMRWAECEREREEIASISVGALRRKAGAYDLIARAYRLGTCEANADRLVRVASVAHDVRDEACATRDLAVKERIAAVAEAERLRASLNAIAEALDMVNRAEGQGGVDVASVDELIGAIEELQRAASTCHEACGERDEARFGWPHGPARALFEAAHETRCDGVSVTIGDGVRLTIEVGSAAASITVYEDDVKHDLVTWASALAGHLVHMAKGGSPW